MTEKAELRALQAKSRSRKRSGLTKANYQALSEFRFALRKFLAFSEQAASAAGLTPQQHQALLAIKGARGREFLSIGEIAQWLLIRHHTAVELVDRLSELGLVERKADPEDGRRMRVVLTPDGTAAIGKLSSVHIHELGSIRPTLRKLLKQFD